MTLEDVMEQAEVFAADKIDFLYEKDFENVRQSAKNLRAAIEAYAAERVKTETERCALLMEQQHTWITNVAAAQLIRAIRAKEEGK